MHAVAALDGTSGLSKGFLRGYAALRSYIARTGSADVPVQHAEGDVALGSWVSYQRAKNRRGVIHPQAKALLEALPGWRWRAWDREWKPAIALMAKFVEREGHAQIPADHVEDGFDLGAWAARQRYRYRSGRIKSRRLADIKAIPGLLQAWNTVEFDRAWKDKFKVLRAFAKAHGHTRVPRNYASEGVNLGIWVNSMRSHYNRGKLAPERIAQLESVPGWTWAEPRRSKTPS